MRSLALTFPSSQRVALAARQCIVSADWRGIRCDDAIIPQWPILTLPISHYTARVGLEPAPDIRLDAAHCWRYDATKRIVSDHLRGYGANSSATEEPGMARRSRPGDPNPRRRDDSDRYTSDRNRFRDRQDLQRGATPQPQSDAFTCGHCQRYVGPLPSGGHNRNHCPFCLYSRHVDAERSGDRASACKGLMEPIGVFERPNGEEVLVHRCVKCGFERFNRVGADDDEAQVAALPRVEPRRAGPNA